jgi:hypothetical protein
MFKTKKLFLLLFCFIFTKLAFAEFSISGYTEFTAGSADQTTNVGTTDQGVDKAGLSNGIYSRLNGTYSTTLDSGIDVSGTFMFGTRDCNGDKTANCDVTNHNFATFSGGFGSVSIGERFDAGAMMLSRMTASGPTAEPDGAIYADLYDSDGVNFYGSANERTYANNTMKILYASDVYSGFSFAASFTPNDGATGAAIASGQLTTTGDYSNWNNFNDVLEVYGKYAMEMDGIGLELVYGTQTGNAGQIAGTNYNDLDETSYSVKVSYGGFSADYRKNEAGNSGFEKNSNAGNDEGTSVCGEYAFGSMRVNACQVQTSFTDTSNLSNSADTMTYAADYNLGGGVTIGLLYFDVEQTANSQIRTDVDGVMSILMIGF